MEPLIHISGPAADFIVFTDEKVFSVAVPSNTQNEVLDAASDGSVKRKLRLMRTRPIFIRSVTVSVGRTSIHFVESGVKVNGQYYRDTLLMQRHLPEIRELSE